MNSLPYDVNALIGAQGGVVEVYNNMDFDYDFSNPPILNNDGLQLGAKSIFFDVNKGEVDPKVTPPTLP
jgi:hypothetical protein